MQKHQNQKFIKSNNLKITNPNKRKSPLIAYGEKVEF